MKKRVVSMLMGLMLSVTTVFGSLGTTGMTVSAAQTGVTDADCSDKGDAVTAPTPDDVLPDANQYRYQKDELAAFCHFGPNTFNEIEWGENYGSKTPDEIFMLEDDFDAMTMVRTLKNAGFKRLIVTAKHHDGFCIWNSAYTDYCVKNTSYKDGKGDVLAELSEACTYYDMDMGLYLSPWDIHEPAYGYYDENGNPTDAEHDAKDYNDYYNNQLEEILGNDKYGNNGHFVEVWMDGAKGSGANAQEYDFTRWFTTIQKYEGKAAGYDADCSLFGAKAYTTVRWIGNEDGKAYEDTWSKSTVNYDNNSIDSNGETPYTKGYENGNKWTVPECDGRITSGWFWGTQKNTPKTITQLADMYFNSVGHNSTMLLNVPPNNKGSVDQAILDRVTEFGENIEDTFRNNLAASATISASNVRGNDVDYKPGNVVDNDDATYWTTDDGSNSGSITIKWDSAKSFDIVSIEEAIQNGQRINSYKVEYRESENAEWKTLKSGVVVGAKRLVRTAPVSATEVRITVSTTSGKVPMLSEVGIYKASEGFELAGAAPDGMEVASINDTSKFTFSSTGWNPQTGTEYINGHNTWSNAANATATFTFEGTKVYLMGTQDPNHGQADIYIDDVFVETIDTHASSRTTGSVIFESADLEDKAHTLKLVAKTAAGAIGLEAAYVINNGGVGMIELEDSAYTMNEDSSLDVVVKRVGGTKGEVKVLLQPNPGSAIQDDFNTENIKEVVFAEGVSEVTVEGAAITTRNTNITGDRAFTIELTKTADTPKNLILGFNDSARITIKDADAITAAKLQALVTECQDLEEHLYKEGWSAFATALLTAQKVVENSEAANATIINAYTALETAKNELVLREKYTTDDRFQFPSKKNTSVTLEAEFATEMINSNDSDSDPDWPLQISTESWASNGKFVNCLSYKDYVKYTYNAEKTGTYTVTVTYRSGSDVNKLSWSEAEGKITAGEVSTPNSKVDNVLQPKTVEFDMVVTTAGTGVLSFTAPDTGNGPQIDKFVITAKDIALDNFDITATAGQGGAIAAEGLTDGTVSVVEGSDVTFTITPDAGYEIEDVKVDGTSVGKKTTYTFADVQKAHTIEATFRFVKYTEGNAFVFPSVKGNAVRLEAEYATEMINSNESDSDPDWPLQISTESWASNGKFVNCLAYKDYVKYSYAAQTAGTYKVTVTYRSGSDVNKLAWSEANGKITAGQVATGNSKENNVLQAKTVEFEMVVATAGAGVLSFTAPDTGNGPQIDCFDIELIRVEGEKEDADLTALQTAISNAEAILTAEDHAKYSEEELANLQEMVDNAKKLTVDSEQSVIDAAKDAIAEQIARVQTQFTITATAGEGGSITPNGAVKLYLGTEKEFTVIANEGYHIESIVIDGTAMTISNTVKETFTIGTSTSDRTVTATFAKDVVPVDKAELLSGLNTAKEKLAETDKYTEETFKALQDAVTAAQKVYDNADATQDEVDQAKAAVDAAVKALVVKPEEKPDVKPEEKPVATEDDKQKAQDYLTECKDFYTEDNFESEEAWVAYQEAMTALEELLAQGDMTQEALQEAIEAVKASVAAVDTPDAPEVPGTDDVDTDNKDDNTADDSKDDSVVTGDSASIMMWVMVLVMAATVVIMKKRTDR